MDSRAVILEEDEKNRTAMWVRSERTQDDFQGLVERASHLMACLDRNRELCYQNIYRRGPDKGCVKDMNRAMRLDAERDTLEAKLQETHRMITYYAVMAHRAEVGPQLVAMENARRETSPLGESA